MDDLLMAKGLELFWEQPKASQRKFVLCSGDQIFATLDFNSSFSTLGDGIMSEGHWTFKRVGFIPSRVIVCKSDSEVDFATYHPSWTGSHGQVQFSTREVYSWGVANFWGSRYSINSEDGYELITYKSGSRNKKLSNIFKQQAGVVIAPEAWQIRELPILALLGWYLVILQREDSSAVAVTASIGVLN